MTMTFATGELARIIAEYDKMIEDNIGIPKELSDKDKMRLHMLNTGYQHDEIFRGMITLFTDLFAVLAFKGDKNLMIEIVFFLTKTMEEALNDED